MKELTKRAVWAHCSNVVASGKAPAVGLGKSKPISYRKALTNAQDQIAGSPYMGLVFGDESDYIGFDVDVDPEGLKRNSTKEIPENLLTFLQTHPTHIHYSPSGYGIHFIYYIDNDTQQYLNLLNLKQGAISIDQGGLFNGDWRYRNSFLVFTDQLHPLSVSKIATISLEDLQQINPAFCAPEPASPEVEVPPPGVGMALTEAGCTVTQIPSLAELQTVLTGVPSTFNNIAKRACQGLPGLKPKTNYEYWVFVGCACAHHAIQLENCGRHEDSLKVLDYFIEWSSKDTESFTGELDVTSKYFTLLNSTKIKLESDQPIITIGSLIALRNNCIIGFPDMIAKGKTYKPDLTSVKNLLFLMDYDELEMKFDPMGGGVCFTGPEETITKWFCTEPNYKAIRFHGTSQVASFSDMGIRFKAYMQDRYQCPVTEFHAREAINVLSQSMKRENAFAQWIKSSPWDGVPRFESVCNSIVYADTKQENRDMYTSYIRRSFLSLVGIHFWESDRPKIPAMLVLTGPEYTFKSSWAEWLIPEFMGNYVATVDIDTILSGSKDWLMFMATKAIIVINECEPLFVPKHEQKVKSNVDSETVTYRDLYAKQLLTRPRTALIIGTTNKPHLFTGSTGTRKIWQIPVSECDSMLIKNMDLQQLYAEIYEILRAYKKNNPDALIQTAWGQNTADREKTNQLNAEKKENNVGALGLLIEKFGSPSDRRFRLAQYTGGRNGLKFRPGNPSDLSNKPNAWTVTSMFQFLSYEFPLDKLTRVAVKYALEEYSARFTNTTHKAMVIPGCRRNQIMTRGKIDISKTTYYYLMPVPIIDPFNTEDLDTEEQGEE